MTQCKQQYGGRPLSSLEQISQLTPTTAMVTIQPTTLHGTPNGNKRYAVEATSFFLLLHAR